MPQKERMIGSRYVCVFQFQLTDMICSWLTSLLFEKKNPEPNELHFRFQQSLSKSNVGSPAVSDLHRNVSSL